MKRFILALVLVVTFGSGQAAPVGIYWTDIGNGLVNTSNTDGTVNFAQLDGSGITTLASGLNYPGGISVMGDHMFWADRNEQVVYQAYADGTGIAVSYTTSPGTPRDVAITPGFIYIANSGISSISRMNRDGTGYVDLVTAGLVFPTGITVTDDYLYWSDSGTAGIWRSNLDGTNALQIVAGLPNTHLPTSIFITDSYIYWATRDIALNQGGTVAPGTIQRSNLDGTVVITLVDDLVFPQQTFVTDDYLYWVDQKTGKLQRANLDGTGQVDLVTGLTTPIGLSIVTAPAEPGVSIVIEGGTPQECSESNGANINFTADTSNLPPEDPVNYIEWFLDGATVGVGESLTAKVPLGLHTIQAVATTAAGATFARDEPIEVEDTAAPVIEVAFLHPKTGAEVTMVGGKDKATAYFSVSDICDSSPVISATTGIPTQVGDIVAARTAKKDDTVTLSVNGNAGTVELTVMAEDFSGNMSSDKAVLTVIQ